MTPLSGSTTLGLLLINTKGQNNFPVELTHDFFLGRYESVPNRHIVQIKRKIPFSSRPKNWTILSAITFLERCRKVVREIWFEKSGSKKMVQEKWLTRKKGGFIP